MRQVQRGGKARGRPLVCWHCMPRVSRVHTPPLAMSCPSPPPRHPQFLRDIDQDFLPIDVDTARSLGNVPVGCPSTESPLSSQPESQVHPRLATASACPCALTCSALAVTVAWQVEVLTVVRQYLHCSRCDKVGAYALGVFLCIP